MISTFIHDIYALINTILTYDIYAFSSIKIKLFNNYSDSYKKKPNLNNIKKK